jgi:hypothetical protein
MRGYIAEQDTLDYLLEQLSVVTSQVIGNLPKIVLITDPPSHFNCARSCLPDRSLFHSLYVMTIQSWKQLETCNQRPNMHVPTRGDT